MNFSQIENIAGELPAFRKKQIFKAAFKDLIVDWDEATALSVGLRQELQKECLLEISAEFFVSQKGDAIKALLRLNDGLAVEAVLMRHKGRNTVCVSSQVGCAMGCVFCATGVMGFKRNLDAWEILEQALFFARFLKKENEKINNIVFMGMGEPFLNYENVMAAARILNDNNAFGIGARKISISTAGIIEGILKMADEPLQFNLAISLHSPFDKLRSEIMPVNKKYPISDILKAADYYIEKTGRKVMIEYLMLSGVNDSEKCARALAELLRGRLYFVNLISYNPTEKFNPSLPEQIVKFRKIIEGAGIRTGQRYRFGIDIKAACGQLALR